MSEDEVRCRKCGSVIRWFQSSIVPDNSRWLSDLNGAWCVEGDKHEPQA